MKRRFDSSARRGQSSSPSVSHALLREIGELARGAVLVELRRHGRVAFDDMRDCCSITSFVLQRALRQLGIRSTYVSGYFDGWGHSWLEVDGQIVDATATQFGVRSKVYLPRGPRRYETVRRGYTAVRTSVRLHNYRGFDMREAGERIGRWIAITAQTEAA